MGLRVSLSQRFGFDDMLPAFAWMYNDQIDEEGCSPIFASLLYG